MNRLSSFPTRYVFSVHKLTPASSLTYPNLRSDSYNLTCNNLYPCSKFSTSPASRDLFDGYFTGISTSAPVAGIQDLLVSVHDFTHLPWYSIWNFVLFLYDITSYALLYQMGHYYRQHSCVQIRTHHTSVHFLV